MIQSDTEQAASGLRSPTIEVVATLSFGVSGKSDIKCKRYADGAVMLGQGNDLVYLEPEQLEMLQRFMSQPIPSK